MTKEIWKDDNCQGKFPSYFLFTGYIPYECAKQTICKVNASDQLQDFFPFFNGEIFEGNES